MTREANEETNVEEVSTLLVKSEDEEVLTITVQKYFCIIHGEGFFQYEIIINILVSCSRFF